jgi:hypothetical protein
MIPRIFCRSCSSQRRQKHLEMPKTKKNMSFGHRLTDSSKKRTKKSSFAVCSDLWDGKFGKRDTQKKMLRDFETVFELGRVYKTWSASDKL